jgi:hypothetical protein
MLGVMPKRSGKDVNQIAHAMVEMIASGDIPPNLPTTPDGKNPFAVALGRRGGLKGGRARAAGMTAKQRSESAKKAAQARWRKTNIEK